jgi:dTDP-4-amino-4,6-dideoxygalactose transaminase
MTVARFPASSVASSASSLATAAMAPNRWSNVYSSSAAFSSSRNTKVRKNMRARLLAYADKLLLRKRAMIERVNDQLKNVCQIEHTRRRSPYNFLAHLLAGLCAYCHQPKKPSLRFDCARDTLPAA